MEYQHSNTHALVPSQDDVDSLSKRKDLLGWIQLIERRSPRGWSLVIMPQEIRIDIFHGSLHIHPPQGRGEPRPIVERSLESVRDVVRRHVEARGAVRFEELVEELR